MKKAIFLLFVGLIFSINNYAQSFSKSESLTSGFAALNQKDSKLKSDELKATKSENSIIAGSIVYEAAINPSSYTINTALSVGKTPGNLAAQGSASYNIPLAIPKGTNGMQPSINLNYISTYSDGLMGIGWNIGGISSINRINKTIYHDSKSDAIRGDLTDKYALDGNRLIVTTGTYGTANSEYRTELEEFSKVVAYGSTLNGSTVTGPDWFKVYTKSGLIYEFGNTEDSKIRNDNNSVLSWKVSKISDRYNNYITFSYITTDDEHPISEINYTGNSSISLSPFAQIIFNYKSRSDISNYCYGGKLFSRDILLDNIEIKNNGQTFKKYAMTYMKDVFSQLQKVTEYSGQNTALNPTVFAWTDQTEQFTQSSNLTSYLNENTFFGDFNGDGRDDLVTVPAKSSYTSSDKWKLYLANTSGSLVYTSQGDLNSSFLTFMIADFNGDGLTDLAMEEYAATTDFPNKVGLNFYQSTGTSFTRSSASISCNYGNTLNIIDYDGDGKLEYFYNSTDSQWYIMTYSGNSVLSGTIPSFGKYYIVNTGLQNRILDFNNDGCSDLLTLFSTGYKIYEFKGTNNALIETFAGTDLKTNNLLLFGDYNGDGRTDIIKEALSGSPDWSMLLLKNGGFQSSELTCFDNFSIDYSNNRIFAREMDGDGKTDIVLVGKGQDIAISLLATTESTTSTYNKINVALSTGNDFNITEYISSTIMQSTDDRYFNFADFNGDGRNQLFYKYSTTTPLLFSFATGVPSHLINTVIDGFGAKSTITYLPMSNSSVYTKGTGATYPVTDFSSSLQLVSQVSGDNGIGGTSAITYLYSGAKIHQRGKGFLGFSKTTVTNGATGIVSENNYTFDETYFYPQLTTAYTKQGSSTLSTTVNVWNEINFGSNRIYPYISTSTQTNNLTGFVTSSTNSTPDNYGNITSSSTAYSNGPTHSQSIVYNHDLTNWLITRPCSITTTQVQGTETITKLITRSYLDGQNQPDIDLYKENGVTKWQLNRDYNANGTLAVFHEYSEGIGEKHTYYTYDPNGVNTTQKTEADGTITNYTYYATTGLPNIVTDNWGNATTYNYDNFGNVNTVTPTGGIASTTSMAWVTTPANARYSVTLSGVNGSQTVTYYDLLGREIRRGAKLFDGTISCKQTDYNAKGQAYRVSEPFLSTGSASLWNTTIFDRYGRDSIFTPPVGASSSYAYSGGVTTVTSNGRTYSTTTTNATGWQTSKTDPGGTISYSYKPDGNVKQITAPGNVITTMTYDTQGNQLSLIDPSAGSTTYTYCGAGELKTQITPLGTTTNYYLVDGRLDYYTNPAGTYDYTYGTNKQVSGISSPGGVARSYTYYPNGKIDEISETIETGQTNKVKFVYDSYGRVSTKTYTNSSNVSQTESYVYNSYGYLDQVKFNDVVVYDVSTMNTRGQITAATVVGTSANWGYNAYGQLTSSSAYYTQSYYYTPNPTTGNLTSRNNSLKSLTETFYYDNLDRLDSVRQGSTRTLLMGYDTKGNITTKSDAGTLVYDNGKPYQLAHVTPYTSNFPTVSQTATYTSFGKVSTLAEGNYSATFKYNADNERIKMVISQSGTAIKTKYYFGSSYEKVIEGTTTTEYIWIGGNPYTAVAVAKIVNGATPVVYAIFRDNLGTITHLKSSSETLEYSFDAYGRRRDKDTWSYTVDDTNALFADRGFTGHEHLTQFGLINMNGRLYDPLVGRFLSPDNYVQSPDFTQNFNRYGYCLNNPLRFNDPSGQINQNIFERGQSPSLVYMLDGGSGANSNESLMDFSFDGFRYSGAPGQGDNGTGINGIYFDYYTNSWQGPNGLVTTDIIYSSIDGYATFRGFHFSDGREWYTEDGLGSLNSITGFPSGQGDGVLDKGLDYAGKTNDAVDAFAKTLGTNGLTAVMVSGGKTIGRYSGPAGIVISTGQVFNGVRKDGFTYGYNAQKATAGAVGGMAGAWAGFQAGAWAGFEAGFTIGLAFEGVGAIPGAVIGGIVGGFGGAWGGAYGGSKLGESLISNKAQ